MTSAAMTFHSGAASYRNRMRHVFPIRVAAVSCLAWCVAAGAQAQHKRHAKPSAAVAAPPVAPAPQPVAPVAPPTPAELPARRAGVTYANGQLKVVASNSSLDQILRDVSRETGMKITGGVKDERVFGNYGPASAAQVLSALLDGTESNMMLVGSNGPAPAELVLTPRGGGPTPPNPNAAAEAEESQPAENQPSSEVFHQGPPLPPDRPINNVPQPGPAAGDEQPKSPNGVKSPQDIFKELQEMRQKQAEQNNNQRQ